MQMVNFIVILLCMFSIIYLYLTTLQSPSFQIVALLPSCHIFYLFYFWGFVFLSIFYSSGKSFWQGWDVTGWIYIFLIVKDIEYFIYLLQMVICTFSFWELSNSLTIYWLDDLFFLCLDF